MSIRAENMVIASVAFQRVCESFSLGLEFLTPKKRRKEKEKREQTGSVSSCLAKAPGMLHLSIFFLCSLIKCHNCVYLA